MFSLPGSANHTSPFIYSQQAFIIICFISTDHFFQFFSKSTLSRVAFDLFAHVHVFSDYSHIAFDDSLLQLYILNLLASPKLFRSLQNRRKLFSVFQSPLHLS